MSTPAERALALILIAYLRSTGWEVYEEVRFRIDPQKPSIWVADIVATQDGVVAVYELKTAFGLDVMDQGERWVGHANQVFVVVPGDGRAKTKGHACGYRHLTEMGVGVLHIRQHTKLERQMAQAPGGALPPPEALVSILHRAAVHPCSTVALEAVLHPQHQTGAFAGAGSKNGDRLSKTNLFYLEIHEYLKQHGGVARTLDVARHVELTDRIVTRWAEEQKIRGVQLDRRTAVYELRLVEEGAEAPLTPTSHKSRPARYIPS